METSASVSQNRNHAFLQKLLFIFTMQSYTMKKSAVRGNVWLTTGRGRKHSHRSIPSFPPTPRRSVRSSRWRFRSASGPTTEQNRRVTSPMHLLMFLIVTAVCVSPAHGCPWCSSDYFPCWRSPPARRATSSCPRRRSNTSPRMAASPPHTDWSLG